MINSKYLFYISTLMLELTACTQSAPSISHQRTVFPISFKKIHKRIPFSYFFWLTHPHNLNRVENYKHFLQQQEVQPVVPDFEFFRSARDWKACHYDQYDVPRRNVWVNIVPTLHLLFILVKQGV